MADINDWIIISKTWRHMAHNVEEHIRECNICKIKMHNNPIDASFVNICDCDCPAFVKRLEDLVMYACADCGAVGEL